MRPFGILAALALILAASTARADDCQLVRIASLPITGLETGRILVPVTIEGTPELMLLDTGAPASTIEADTAAALQLKTQTVFQEGMYNSLGQQFTTMAMIHSLGIDHSTASLVRVLVSPSRLSPDKRIAGTLGADLLRHYDVELDFANKTVNLFSQDHCTGKVVYWPASGVAVVPMHVVNSGHIIVPVTLDGHDLDALLDTGAPQTAIDLTTAENTFGFQRNTPQMPLVGEMSGSRESVFAPGFKSLSLNGLSIGNPKVFAFEDLAATAIKTTPYTGSRLGEARAEYGSVPVTLGIAEMRRVHIYIAYKEQTLYITAPSAAVGNIPAPTSPPVAPTEIPTP